MNKILQLLPQREEVCFVVKQAFPKSFCDQLILQKKHSFQSAQSHYPTSYRNNQRQLVDSQVTAEILFSKIKNYVPTQIKVEGIAKEEKGTWNLKTLNDRLRICRYLPGQYFNKHLDGVHFRSRDLQSKLTFMVYLNNSDEYTGGRTLFFDSKEDDTVIQSYLPEAGDLIIFDHNLWHSGEEVRSGEKYILRSDILYQKECSSFRTMDSSPFEEGHLGYIWSIIQNGNNIITAGRDRLIKIWNLASKQKIEELSGHQNSIFTLLNLCNGNLLLSASRDQFINFWKKEDSQFVYQKALRIHNASVLTLSKYDEQSFLSGGGDGRINLVHIDVGVKSTWKAHEGWIWQIVKISATEICSVGEDGYLKIWNIYTQKLICSYRIGIPINTVVYHHSRKMIFIGDATGNIHSFIRSEEGSSLHFKFSFQAHHGIIRQMKFFNELLITGGEDSKVKFWNIDTQEILQMIKHDNFVQDFIIEKDNLISVSYDGQILRTKMTKKVVF